MLKACPTRRNKVGTCAFCEFISADSSLSDNDRHAASQSSGYKIVPRDRSASLSLSLLPRFTLICPPFIFFSSNKTPFYYALFSYCSMERVTDSGINLTSFSGGPLSRNDNRASLQPVTKGNARQVVNPAVLFYGA